MVRWMVTVSYFSAILHSTYSGKNVIEAERMNAFPTQKIIVLRFGEAWWLMNLSECMNAFPTKHLSKSQFALTGGEFDGICQKNKKTRTEMSSS